MKFLLLLFIFLLTLNCSFNKVSNSHGSRFFDTQYDNIILNKTNKNDIRKLIGPPSSISKFNDSWFYIERIKTNQSVLKLGKKKISNNNVLLLKFNYMGIVVHKEMLDLNDMNDVKTVEKITKKKFDNNNRLYDILSSLREKVNAPTKRKK